METIEKEEDTDLKEHERKGWWRGTALQLLGGRKLDSFKSQLQKKGKVCRFHL